jgi:single-strand DNA-binding protein
MPAGNHVTLVGNATREPELRFTQSGAAVCNFGIANNRSWKDKDGEWQEETSFFDIVCWQDLAENVASSVKTGSRVIVEGRMDQRSWDDKDTGDKRYKIECVADDVGVSLRWAEVDIHKNERKGDGGGNERGGRSEGRSRGGDGGGRESGGGRSGRGSGRSGGRQEGQGRGRQEPDQEFFDDEEPF